MGSRSEQLARARHASSLLIDNHPRQGPKYLQWPGLDSTRMNFLKIVASFLLLLSASLSSPALHIRARRSDGYNDVGECTTLRLPKTIGRQGLGVDFFAGLRALQLDGESVLP